MKLNDEQLEYIHDEYRIPIDTMRNLDAYRGWVNIGYWESCSECIESIILCDDYGNIQYSFMAEGDLPGEDSLPWIDD